jgi:integrase
MARLSWSKSLPIALWPNADRGAWGAALRPGNVFDAGGSAARWSPATQRKTALGYGRFLFWLSERGELDVAEAPRARITCERAAAYLEELKRTNRGHTIHNRIQELGNAMRALAPEGDWRWLLRAAGRLRANAVPVQQKRARLRPIGELVAEGFQLMERAERDNSLSALGRAALYRDGLLLAFLGLHPLRLRNLASLRVGCHLIEQGDAFVLKLAAAETKGRQMYEAVVIPRLSLALKRYLGVHRLVLLNARGRWHGAAGDALWISRDGSTCSEQTFTNIILKRTGADGRPRLSPHLFRSCAATTIAIDRPGSIDIVPAILGHASPTTAERYYNLAGSIEASRAQAAILEGLLSEVADDLLDPDRRHEGAVKHPPHLKQR